MSIEEKKLADFLISRNLRKTPERFEILRSTLECKGHFDVERLYNMLEFKGYHVSKATIYNTLEILSEAGIVRKLLFDTHQAMYELADDTHAHLVCTQCGKIREIKIEPISNNIKDENLPEFSISYTSICVYGICEDCLKKTK